MSVDHLDPSITKLSLLYSIAMASWATLLHQLPNYPTLIPQLPNCPWSPCSGWATLPAAAAQVCLHSHYTQHTCSPFHLSDMHKKTGAKCAIHMKKTFQKKREIFWEFSPSVGPPLALFWRPLVCKKKRNCSWNSHCTHKAITYLSHVQGFQNSSPNFYLLESMQENSYSLTMCKKCHIHARHHWFYSHPLPLFCNKLAIQQFKEWHMKIMNGKNMCFKFLQLFMSKK